MGIIGVHLVRVSEFLETSNNDEVLFPVPFRFCIFHGRVDAEGFAVDPYDAVRFCVGLRVWGV